MTPPVAPYFDGSQPCAHHDPSMWFATPAEDAHAHSEAVRICGGCPFRAPCAQWALDNNERYGVWGGLTEQKREGRAPAGAGTRPGPTHGKVNTYVHHQCRCDLCCDAWDKHLAKQREQRREHRQGVRAIGEHGYNAYSYGCRCNTCRAAKAEYSRDARQKKAS